MDFLLMDFDVNGLYPTTMSDKESVYPKTETRCEFTKDMSEGII